MMTSLWLQLDGSEKMISNLDLIGRDLIVEIGLFRVVLKRL